jgi:hypothetical protein
MPLHIYGTQSRAGIAGHDVHVNFTIGVCEDIEASWTG